MQRLFALVSPEASGIDDIIWLSILMYWGRLVKRRTAKATFKWLYPGATRQWNVTLQVCTCFPGLFLTTLVAHSKLIYIIVTSLFVASI